MWLRNYNILIYKKCYTISSRPLGNKKTFFHYIGDAKQFYPNLGNWLHYSKTTNGPMIYVGVPSHEAAAFGRGYWRTPDEMATIYNVSSPGIGCF